MPRSHVVTRAKIANPATLLHGTGRALASPHDASRSSAPHSGSPTPLFFSHAPQVKPPLVSAPPPPRRLRLADSPTRRVDGARAGISPPAALGSPSSQSESVRLGVRDPLPIQPTHPRDSDSIPSLTGARAFFLVSLWRAELEPGPSYDGGSSLLQPPLPGPPPRPFVLLDRRAPPASPGRHFDDVRGIAAALAPRRRCGGCRRDRGGLLVQLPPAVVEHTPSSTLSGCSGGLPFDHLALPAGWRR